MNPEKLPIYEIPKLMKGIFKARPNRFIAKIKYKGKIELAHVHDPGRLKELFIEDSEVLFTHSNGKLKYYIKAVKCESEWVLVDSAQHSKIAKKIFAYLPEFSEVKEIKAEVPLGRSRIDFVLDGVPLEVKGVSLVKNGLALFPDAPTERGTRHVGEIIDHKGVILFLIFRKARVFAPNQEMDAKFSQKLIEARIKKVPIIAVQISFDGKMLYYHGKIPLADF
jgi:sugar fermentation stimulation protein A